MKDFSLRGFFAPVAALLIFAPALHASKPFMMMPPSYEDNRCLKELFQHPEQWEQTRSKVDTLGAADWLLSKNFTDDELKNWMPLLDQWHIKLQLEVGAVKEWGQTGEAAFKTDQRYWERITKFGGKIDSIGMDEPLCCARFALKKPDSYAVEETANFIKLVREKYPDMKIGDIEPYPTLSLQDLTTWIDALQAALKQKGVRGLDFFRVDVDWMHFVYGMGGNYKEVKKLELFCRSRNIPFSLVYWAANHPGMVKRGLGDDSTWYISTMQMGYDYAAVDGSPDEYVVESWVDGPSHSVPETDPWTFTRSVLDFHNRFVK